MSKSEKIAILVRELGLPENDRDPRYLAFFELFNSQRYYEAHDALEDLWLQDRGPSYPFYKGLIQLAGGFVHMQKQFENPGHPKHGRRLHPALRLLELARANLDGYPETYHGLQLPMVRELIDQWVAALRSGQFRENPWTPSLAPRIPIG